MKFLFRGWANKKEDNETNTEGKDRPQPKRTPSLLDIFRSSDRRSLTRATLPGFGPKESKRGLYPSDAPPAKEIFRLIKNHTPKSIRRKKSSSRAFERIGAPDSSFWSKGFTPDGTCIEDSEESTLTQSTSSLRTPRKPKNKYRVPKHHNPLFSQHRVWTLEEQLAIADLWEQNAKDDNYKILRQVFPKMKITSKSKSKSRSLSSTRSSQTQPIVDIKKRPPATKGPAEAQTRETDPEKLVKITPNARRDPAKPLRMKNEPQVFEPKVEPRRDPAKKLKITNEPKILEPLTSKRFPTNGKKRTPESSKTAKRTPELKITAVLNQLRRNSESPIVPTPPSSHTSDLSFSAFDGGEDLSELTIGESETDDISNNLQSRKNEEDGASLPSECSTPEPQFSPTSEAMAEVLANVFDEFECDIDRNSEEFQKVLRNVKINRKSEVIIEEKAIAEVI